MNKFINRFMVLLIDATIFAFSSIVAAFLRMGKDDFFNVTVKLYPYFIISFVSSLAVFLLFGIYRYIWRFFSLHEFRNILLAVILALLISVLISFSIFRLEQVPRSLPFIQGLVALAGISGLRLLGRWRARLREQQIQHQEKGKEQRHGVLIIGFTPVADIYLRSVELFGSDRLAVVGILDESAQYRGQRMRHCEVLGTPKELPHILKQLQIHGVAVRKLVMATSYDLLSESSRQAIARLKAEHRVYVEDFCLLLNACMQHDPLELHEPFPLDKDDAIPLPAGLDVIVEQRLAKYEWLKRGVDVGMAALIGVLALPILAMIIPLVRLTMGRPVFFWQERPGRSGRILRIYKLRTLKHGVSPEGRLLTDEERQTKLGKLLRRLRIDELPQIYNILKGDLSLIGPRPLLPVDLPEDMPGWIRLRRLARPGLTGWAQVHGGQALEKHLKVIMDVWYLANMSPALDLKILWFTVLRLLKGRGEMVHPEPIEQACRDLGVSWEQVRKFGLTEPESGMKKRKADTPRNEEGLPAKPEA